MGNLLFDDQPLVIQPSLAKIIGLNEAIFLQQLHYWLQKSSHHYDGRAWVYNTYQGWQEQFPFWGVNTIRRIVEKLEQMGVILAGNYNQSRIDKTKWYSIDYAKLDELSTAQNGQIDCKNSQSSAQNEQMDCPEWADDLPNLGRPIPEITTETTSESDVDEDEGARAQRPDPYITYEQNMGVLAPIVREDISYWMDGGYFDEPHEIIVEAISIAVKNGARRWAYANKILLDWADNKLRTLQQVRAYSLEYEGRVKHAQGDKRAGRSNPDVRGASITGGQTGWLNRPKPKPDV